MLLFRGTQHQLLEQTVRSAISCTPSLFAATIYSAVPGDVWSRRPTAFCETSTVHFVTADKPRVFDLRRLGSYCSLREVLEEIGYPDNISGSEVDKVYTYLHRRIIGRAKGGEFRYKVFDIDADFDEWEEVDEAAVPFDLLYPETSISYVAKDAFDAEPTLSTTSNVVADTYAFLDAPQVQRAIRRLGYDVVAYVDTFEGASFAAKDLFGLGEEELLEQEGIWEDSDIDDEDVLMHESYRILDLEVITRVVSMPVDEAIRVLETGAAKGSKQ